MMRSLADVLAHLERVREATDEVLRKPPADRPAAVCSALHELLPDSVCACALLSGGERRLAVTDARGCSRPDWDEAVREPLWQAFDAGEGATVTLSLEAGQSAKQFILQPISGRGQHSGGLACALSADEQEVEPDWVRAVLALVADRLSLLMALEVQQPAGPSASGTSGDRLGTIAEMTSLVTHEFNNYLNGIVLQVALLEQTLPPAIRSDLGAIRKIGNEAATLVRRLQQYNRQELPQLQPVELNQVIGEVLQSPGSSVAEAVLLELDPNIPPVLGIAEQLARLVRNLIASARAAAGDHGRVSVATRRAGSRVMLSVRDAGPPVPADELAHLFDPFVAVRPGGDGISLAISKVLTRRMRGHIRGENPPEGGVAIIVELSPADGA